MYAIIFKSIRTYILMEGCYINTHLEDYIQDLYKYLRINRPNQLTIDSIAKKLDLNIYYGKFSLRFGHDLVIQKSTKQQEWQVFGHELGHYLRHCGNHYTMNRLFIDLQEYHANHFAYHFCVPTFMLQKTDELSISAIMNLFNVEYDFAVKRLEMYQNKLYKEELNHVL
ncbi:ImmA/IrrE family metallo-endopeptidase [Virgibacillus salexigens]|uniref:ImmA/IrrE family metallo-endopeptidase n=2 Tax=Virgibacillus salexigens TaxID=61016 RepID=UPI001F32CE7E|nr:ImmA/IrrE family metallo-endopeptidase [Virgibacillus salexigens]